MPVADYAHPLLYPRHQRSISESLSPPDVLRRTLSSSAERSSTVPTAQHTHTHTLRRETNLNAPSPTARTGYRSTVLEVSELCRMMLVPLVSTACSFSAATFTAKQHLWTGRGVSPSYGPIYHSVPDVTDVGFLNLRRIRRTSGTGLRFCFINRETRVYLQDSPPPVRPALETAGRHDNGPHSLCTRRTAVSSGVKSDSPRVKHRTG